MGRFIGGIFGNTVPVAPGVEAPSAVYSIHDQYYSKQEGGWIIPSGMTATGGTVSDFQVGSDVYRAHIFEHTGTFEITALATGLSNNLEYLVVGGGGGGGGESSQSGGGGAGGFRTNLVGHPVKAADLEGEIAVYTVEVGAGGNGGLLSLIHI